MDYLTVSISPGPVESKKTQKSPYPVSENLVTPILTPLVFK